MSILRIHHVDPSSPLGSSVLQEDSRSCNDTEETMSWYKRDIKRLQAMIDSGRFDLRPELAQQKVKLLSEGFASWSRSDYKAVLEAIEKFGMHELKPTKGVVPEENVKSTREKLIEEVVQWTGKPEANVARYLSVFLQRYGELQDAAKIRERAQRGEKRVEREQRMQLALNFKVMKLQELFRRRLPPYYTMNLKQLLGNSSTSKQGDAPMSSPTVPLPVGPMISYGPNGRSKYFTEDEDLFLILMLYKYGYGEWEAIRNEIRYGGRLPHHNFSSISQSYQQLFQFDWYFKSRNSLEIQKRCDALLRLIEKEYMKSLSPEADDDDDVAEDLMVSPEEDHKRKLEDDIPEKTPSKKRKV